MRRQKIYLETTLFNYYFDTDRDAHESTVALFEDIADGKYEAFTSSYVIEELEKAPAEKRDKMIALIEKYGIGMLYPNEETIRIADIYAKENIIPLKYFTDGLHIAIATVYELDMIVSMNFQHIVKRKTRFETAHINVKNGYKAIEIYSPMEIIDNENY